MEFLVGAGILLGIITFAFLIALITMYAIFAPNDLKELGRFGLKFLGVVAFIVLSVYIGHWIL